MAASAAPGQRPTGFKRAPVEGGPTLLSHTHCWHEKATHAAYLAKNWGLNHGLHPGYNMFFSKPQGLPPRSTGFHQFPFIGSAQIAQATVSAALFWGFLTV